MKIKLIKVVTIIGTVILLLFVILYYLPELSSDSSPLLVLQVSFQQTPDYQVSLKKLEVQRGYPSDYKLDMKNYYYYIKILDRNNRVLFVGKVPNANIIFPIDSSESGFVAGQTGTASQIPKLVPSDEIVLYLPYYKSANKIELFTQTDQIKYELQIEQYKLSIPHIADNLCGNGMCDSNENIVRCFSDCKYQIGEFKDTLTKRLVP